MLSVLCQLDLLVYGFTICDGEFYVVELGL